MKCYKEWIVFLMQLFGATFFKEKKHGAFRGSVDVDTFRHHGQGFLATSSLLSLQLHHSVPPS